MPNAEDVAGLNDVTWGATMGTKRKCSQDGKVCSRNIDS